MTSIDLNLDAGESTEAIRDGSEARLLDLVTSVNVSCGAHAGNRSSMEATVMAAKLRGIVIGAHPSYPDRKNFGRARMNLSAEEVSATIHEQIKKLEEICKVQQAEIHHVKLHGALYNEAAYDVTLAEAVAHGILRFSRNLTVVGLAQSRMLQVCESYNLKTAGEGFVDRAYDSHGNLVPRAQAGALITDPRLAAQQAADIAQNKFVKATDGSLVTVLAKTLCIHSDTPGALSLAKAVHSQLRSLNVRIAPLTQ